SFRRSSGLLDRSPDHNGVAAFRISEWRSGWMLPVLRGPGVRSQDVKVLVSVQGSPWWFDPISPWQPSFRRLDVTEPQRQFTRVHRSDLPLAWRRRDGSGLPWALPLCSRTL